MPIRKYAFKSYKLTGHPDKENSVSTSESLKGKSDQEIWKDFKQGDDRAFIYIYRSYSESMYNYGCQFTTERDYVRDCIQDLFCELIDENRKLGDIFSIKGYLFKCIKRKILSGLKRKYKQNLVDVNTIGFQISINPEVIEITNTFDTEVCQTLQKAINNLPVQQREVILLHFYEGHSYLEISEIIGIKVKSVRMQAYRAIQTLRHGLDSSEFKLAVSILLTNWY